MENFILGFRLGAKIMMECMDNGEAQTIRGRHGAQT